MELCGPDGWHIFRNDYLTRKERTGYEPCPLLFESGKCKELLTFCSMYHVIKNIKSSLLLYEIPLASPGDIYFAAALFGQYIPLQAGIGQQNIDCVNQEEKPQRNCYDNTGTVQANHDPRLRGSGQMEDKRSRNQHRRNGGHRIVNCKLTAQGVGHLPPGHPQFSEQYKLKSEAKRS